MSSRSPRSVARRAPAPAAHAVPATGVLLDRLARPLTDLRISVTDRCNFRCSYCMPKEVFDKDYQYLPHSALLSFEEITRLARLFASARRARRSGSPAASRCCARTSRCWSSSSPRCARREGQPLDLTLTTNGSLLARKAEALEGRRPAIA